ncbi:alpha/beta fold hydrolase [Catenulispora rubra]|uniref:alpha/beta fold hydrolase n=1 Tax=Catenulispora rubra TaxID=280293 RepID=UPI0018922595|nr:alpha/beta hydrolase [Catenulispora rubra]
MPTPPIHVTTWSEAATPTTRAILIHGTMTWGTECFAGQRPLAEHFRLDVPDRRGFGDSPDTAQSDWEVDAEDIAALLDEAPAHLLGHSYGGVVAMAAAILRPEAVLSLTLIEPSALRVAESVPVVAAGLAANRAAFTTDPPLTHQITPEDYLRSGEAFGLPIPAFTEGRLRATRTAMAERPCWEADIPLEPLARAAYPKAVITGDWQSANRAYRTTVGNALLATSLFIAEGIGAHHHSVPGTDHFPHRDRPDVVNELLCTIWS